MSHTSIIGLTLLVAGCVDAVGQAPFDADASPVRALADAERMWASACPVTTELGLCVRPADTSRDLCPDGIRAAAGARRAIARREPDASRALAELGGVAADARAPATVRAQASLRLAEAALERLLAIEPPEGLELTGADGAAARSRERFTAFLADVSRAATDTERQLPSGVAAGARRGQLWQAAARLVLMVPIPRDLLERDQWGNAPRELFCASMRDKAGPLHAKARDAYRACASASAADPGSTAWQSRCRTESAAP